MRNLLSLFDYIYYRIYRFFQDRGDDISEFSATLVLSLMQFLIIIDVMFIVKLIHDYHFPNKFAFLPVLVMIGMFNWYRYERSLDVGTFDDQWKDEEKKRKVMNGWFIGLSLLISFLTPVGTWFIKR